MSSNDNNFENSLDSALNMSQDEIEKLLNGQFMAEDNASDYETADLDSLLSELEAMDDGDIQEISDLLDKAENNEAADPEIIDLLNKQDEVDETPAYDVMDLFSTEEEVTPKESFWKRLLAKFKKTEKNEEQSLEKEEQPSKNEKKPKEKKAKEKAPKEKKGKEKKNKEITPEIKEEAVKEEELSFNNQAEWETIDDTLNGSDAIILELEKEEAKKEEIKIKEKPKKKEKTKKKEKSSKKEEKDSEASENDEKKNKPKKQKKKKKEKKVKEKDIVLYDIDETPLTKKNVTFVFLICILLVVAIIALLVNYASHANRRLAEEAFNEENYLECYQLLYGQHLNESQEVMFHQSKIHLKMESLWNRYDSLMAEKQYLRCLDKLIQFVFDYPQINAYATEWNCEEVVDSTYKEVLDVLYDEYKLMEQDAVAIANIEDDVEYTKTLKELADKKEQNMLKYPNMLPEEEERIGNLAD